MSGSPRCQSGVGVELCPVVSELWKTSVPCMGRRCLPVNMHPQTADSGPDGCLPSQSAPPHPTLLLLAVVGGSIWRSWAFVPNWPWLISPRSPSTSWPCSRVYWDGELAGQPRAQLFAGLEIEPRLCAD